MAFGIVTRTLIMFPLDYFVYGLFVSVVSKMSVSISFFDCHILNVR